MRLIDADALIKCIPSEEYNSRFAVMNAPTVEPKKWIPCSERLPKIEREGQRRGWYITTNGYGSVGMTQYEFYHDLLKTGWQSEHQIVAWMPLPEPYKETESHEREGER